nr:serine protease grass-like [Aedes albopictus]
MKPIVLVGLCIQLVSGWKLKNEVYDLQNCTHNQVCLRMQDCPDYRKYVHKPKKWPIEMTICNQEQIGKQALITSVCCPTTLNDKQCGINSEFSKPNAVVRRISHGEEAKPSQFPWMALLLDRKGDFFCGGTLITNRFVLTAAHCVWLKKKISVRLGENQISQKTDCIHHGRRRRHAYKPLDIKVQKCTIHPKYHLRQKRNDIAVVRLAEEVPFSDGIRPICIPGRGKEELSLIPSQFLVVGGGLTENSKVSATLKFAEVSSMSLETCKNIVDLSNRVVKLDETYVCTAGSNQEKHREGDSGGPLQFKSELFSYGRYVQHGLVSFGIQDGGKCDNTGIYTRVDKYADWIHKEVHSYRQNMDFKPLVAMRPKKSHKFNKFNKKIMTTKTTYDFSGGYETMLMK